MSAEPSPRIEVQVFTREAYPHGARCSDCLQEFVVGQRMCDRLESLTPDGTPVVDVLCEACALRSVHQ